MAGARVGRRRLLARRRASSSSSSAPKGYINRNEFNGHDAHGRRDAGRGEGPLQGVARASPSASTELLGDAARHRLRARRQGHVPDLGADVKPFGKVVICAGTTGYNLDFDVRYLWMRQKEILGSHFANAYECNKANELIEPGQDPAGAVADDGLRGRRRGAPAHEGEQALGKIAILVGADRGGPGQDRRGRGCDPRRGRRLMAAGVRPHPLVRDAVPRRPGSRRRCWRSRRSRCGTARTSATSTARATTATGSCTVDVSTTSSTGSATGTARSSALARRAHGLVPGAGRLRVARPARAPGGARAGGRARGRRGDGGGRGGVARGPGVG